MHFLSLAQTPSCPVLTPGEVLPTLTSRRGPCSPQLCLDRARAGTPLLGEGLYHFQQLLNGAMTRERLEALSIGDAQKFSWGEAGVQGGLGECF